MIKSSLEYLQTSILDRLLDDPTQQGRDVSIRQVKRAVARDIENLLNSRRIIFDPPAGCPELENSLYTYGLQDFTAQNSGSGVVRQKIKNDIERTIARFEPRMTGVRVQFELSGEKGRTLRFSISGQLHADPLSEQVTFDSTLDVNRGRCSISG